MLFWRSSFPSPGWQLVDFHAKRGEWHHRPLGGLDPVPEPAVLSIELAELMKNPPHPGVAPWPFGEYPRQVPQGGVEVQLLKYKRQVLPFLDSANIRDSVHADIAAKVLRG
jgi:hypothetical protein